MAIADQHSIAAPGAASLASLQRTRGSASEMTAPAGDAFADVFRMMANSSAPSAPFDHRSTDPSTPSEQDELSAADDAQQPEGADAQERTDEEETTAAVATCYAPPVALVSETPSQALDVEDAPIDPAAVDVDEAGTEMHSVDSHGETHQVTGNVPVNPAGAVAVTEQPVHVAEAAPPQPAPDAATTAASNAKSIAPSTAAPTAASNTESTPLAETAAEAPVAKVAEPVARAGVPEDDEPVMSQLHAVGRTKAEATPATETAEPVAPAAEPSQVVEPEAADDREQRRRRSGRADARREDRAETAATVQDGQQRAAARADAQAAAPSSTLPPTSDAAAGDPHRTPEAAPAAPATPQLQTSGGGHAAAAAATAVAAAPASLRGGSGSSGNGAAAVGDAFASPTASSTSPAAPGGRQPASGNDQASGTSVADRARLVQRVSKAFQRIGIDGGRIRLRLHPAELGSVRLEMQVTGKEVRARVVVESEAARGLLREHLHDLRARLTEQGMNVQQLDVEWGDTSQGGAEQGGQQSDLGYPTPEQRRGAGRPAPRGNNRVNDAGDGQRSPLVRSNVTVPRAGGMDLMV